MPITHPIVADIPDVESGHLNFDKITYNKGGAVLKQLAAWLGEETFFDGVHTYLERHSYANATLADFLAALEEESGRDLKAWARVWLEEAGLNKLALDLEVADHQVKSAAVVQTAPEAHPVLRPHHLRIGLFDVARDRGWAFARRRTVELDIDGARTPVPQLTGEIASDFALVNDGDLAYARVALDPGSLAVLLTGALHLADALTRAALLGAVE